MNFYKRVKPDAMRNRRKALWGVEKQNKGNEAKLKTFVEVILNDPDSIRKEKR